VEIRCPIASQEQLEWLLDYGTARMAAGDVVALERHLAGCAACREMVAGRQAVQSALDLWEAPGVSPGFNRQLYQRIQQETRWCDRWEPFCWLMAWRGIPAAAAACLIVAGLIVTPRMMLERPASVSPQPPAIRVDSPQPEQVVHDLDDMEMLHNFDRAVGTSAGGAEL